MQLEENRRNNGCGSKQVWMMFDGKSRQWDIGVEERGRELKERWEKENGMAVGEVRLMAEGRMIGWDDLANLADGTNVQVLGNICGGMGKKSRKKKEKNPWEWMAEKKKEELREKEERERAEEREKKLEEESERRESQSKNSETASENFNG